jgi:hypothetical protein
MPISIWHRAPGSLAIFGSPIPSSRFCCPSFGTYANCTDNNCHDIDRLTPELGDRSHWN